MKKLGLIALGLSCVGILSFGVSNDSSQLYAYGDYPAPQKPNSAYSDGHTGGSPAESHGDTWSPAYSHADLPISAHGDTPTPADNRGDGGIINNEAHGDHGGSPANNKGDGGVVINNEEHGDTPSPQV